MKKLILSILGLSLAISSFAQITPVNPSKGAPASGEPDMAGEIVIHGFFDNHGASDTFVWEKTILGPAEWQCAVCDKNTCYDYSISTEEFYLAQHGSGTMDIHLKPNNKAADGAVKIKIFRKSMPSDSAVNTYSFDAWAASVKKIRSTGFDLYPNPAKDYITLKFDTKKPIEVEVFNVLGVAVLSKTHNSEETTIDLSSLQAGVYFIKFVSEEGKVYSKAFKKIN